MTLDGEIAALIQRLQAAFVSSGSSRTWRAHASCVNYPMDIWFEPAHEEEAKSICAACPVRVECLDDAIKWGDMASVRGGLNDEERIKVCFHRKRYQSSFSASIKRATDRGNK